MKIFSFLIATIALFASCSTSVNPEQLYGEWKYSKVEIMNQYPPDVMSAEELNEAHPSINFSRDNDLTIFWNDKQLSHGKFKMEGPIIRYKENLPGGKTREFPFYIKEITAEVIVFETKGEDATRVTARKVK